MNFSALDESLGPLGGLATALCASQRFPHAQRVGAILRARLAVQETAPLGLGDIDGLLGDLQQRYQTPHPEAYLGELIAKQQSQRRQHGVFYTPWPLAQFLTRSAVEIAEREFPGEAPTWLDPACGGGVFLHSLLAETPKPSGLMRGWDSSPIPIALCQAILHAQGHGSVQIEQRDALQFDPNTAPVCLSDAPLIVVGNPPYSNFGKRSISPWLAAELAAYKPLRGERKTNLRDAFLLFLRMAQSLVVAQGRGIIAMVLSTTFLDAITHSQVRASLVSSFDELRIVRLESLDASGDENLFSIRQPTAACVFLRRSATPTRREGAVLQTSLRGSRDQKLEWLSRHSIFTTDWTESNPGGCSTVPFWYASSPSIPECFSQYVSGVQTKNDELFLARSKAQLERQIFERFGEFDPALVRPILVAPFDPWWVYYAPDLLGRARYSVMRHMLGENLGLVFMRQATNEGEYDHFLVTRSLVTDRVFHSRWGAPFLAPLYTSEYGERSSNVQQATPETWLGFVYALVHSRWYRRLAANALRSDFPRIPPRDTFDSDLAAQLTRLGEGLMELHAPSSGFSLLKARDCADSPIRLPGRCPRIESADGVVRLLAVSDQLIAEVAEPIWRYRVGGVAVLRRYLQRRAGSVLSNAELDHFRAIISILSRTAAIRRQIDAILDGVSPRGSAISG